MPLDQIVGHRLFLRSECGITGYYAVFHLQYVCGVNV